MKVEVKIAPNQIDKLKDSLEQKLQVAAIKGWERAVELTPARGETKYSTGQMRQSIRVQKTGDLEYSIFSPAHYSRFVEFGTGPKGQRTGRMPEFPNDPIVNYHSGQVMVTRSRGKLLQEPYIRNTEGMVAQPFLRPALIEGMRVLTELLKEG